MSDDPRLQQAQERARELAATHQQLRALRARVAEQAAEVHDEAARVHEELGAAAVLDPQELRAHAEADRRIAAQERTALATGEVGGPASDGRPDDEQA